VAKFDFDKYVGQNNFTWGEVYEAFLNRMEEEYDKEVSLNFGADLDPETTTLYFRVLPRSNPDYLSVAFQAHTEEGTTHDSEEVMLYDTVESLDTAIALYKVTYKKVIQVLDDGRQHSIH